MVLLDGLARQQWPVGHGQTETIFTETYWDFFEADKDTELLAKWSRIRAFREEVNRQIEEVRTRGEVGASLQANLFVTINADDHAFMRQFHRPEDEKRSVVILPPERWDAWLAADAANSVPFLLPFPAQDLVATVDAPPPAPRTLSLFD